MKQKLFNTKKIVPMCIYCTIGKPSADNSCVLCVKKGVMMPDSKCRHFEYDALKRMPQKTPKLPEFSAEDFSIK